MAANTKLSLPEALRTLENQSTAELRDQWHTTFGSSAPSVRREILVFALAHALQEKHRGRLSKRSQQTLQRFLDPSTQPTVSTQLPAGTRLMREWRGRTHAVNVQTDGYVWNDQRFDSLSAIARAITGTRWSGPRFFGIQTSPGESNGEPS